MPTQRETDREKVLKIVKRSIAQRMSSSSVNEYVEPARGYAKEYGIEDLVEDWLKDGRNEFVSQESAEAWAKTLP